MRDALTAIAALLILVLTAALVAPPLITWEEHRAFIDRTLSRAAGATVRTDGRISVRLLPSPRIRVDNLRIGSSGPDAPALLARHVRTEVELMPLLSGEVKFAETRIARAEVRVPTNAEGALRLPPELTNGIGAPRDWTFEDLLIGQLLITTQTAFTGRTDQFYAEAVQIEAPALIGPWRVEGRAGTVPFRLATGEPAPDGAVQVKLAGGGDLHPRFEIDAKVSLASAGDGVVRPDAAGTARVFLGPPVQAAAAGLPLPVAIQTGFKTAGGFLELEGLSVEAGEGGTSLRLAGGGRVALDDPRVSLKLEGRRLDIDSFIASPIGRELQASSRTWELPALAWPLELDLALGSIGLAAEELTDLRLRGTMSGRTAQIERIAITAPGNARVGFSGEVAAGSQGGIAGRFDVNAPASDRLARFLAKIGAPEPLMTPLDGRPVQLSGDITLAAPVASLRNLRLSVGDATLTGAVRYSEPEPGQRGRIEAQIAARDIDLTQLPQLGGVFSASEAVDMALTLDARGVRYGARAGAGRVSARIVSDGPSLVVETLDVADLAGANARVSGRIAPDGSGRIAGRVTAQTAAPLLDLIGRFWIDGVVGYVPDFLRQGNIDVEVVAERASAGPQGALGLRTTVNGAAAGGRLGAEALVVDGQTQTLNVALGTEDTARWIGSAAQTAGAQPVRPQVARQPSAVTLRGVRVGSGQFNVTVAGDVAGARVETTRAFAFDAADGVVSGGEAKLSAGDLRDLLVLFGSQRTLSGEVPAELTIALGRARGQPGVDLNGRIAGEGVQARLVVPALSDISGEVSLSRLALPWLVEAAALGPTPAPAAGAPWSVARFGELRRPLLAGQVRVRARQIELGRGFTGQDASMLVGINAEGVSLREAELTLAGARIAGSLSVSRQGRLASLIGEGTVGDMPLDALLGASPFGGRLTGSLKFGGSGETPAGLVANLAGAGEIRIANLRLPIGEPSAIERALDRALRDSDPLAARRLEAIVREELARTPVTAVAQAAAPATLVGGVMRLSPVELALPAGGWQGAVAVDLKTLQVEARGTLNARAAPKNWTGSTPFILANLRGPLANPVREIDVGPLTNGLAAIVLQRELEKIEAFEADANERARRSQQLRDERERRERERLAAEEAARQARLREQQAEAERQARLREQQEAERQARIREQQELERQARLRRQEESERLRAIINQTAPPETLPPPLPLQGAPAPGG